MANVPVLDRETEREIEESEYNRIKRNYSMLINPELKAGDLLGNKYDEQAAAQAQAMQARQMQMQAMQEQIAAMKMQNAAVENTVAVPEQPYLVQNARADSILFRADSEVNRNRMQQAEQMATEEDEDEENEDLRPTPATIQYRTAGVQKTEQEGVLQSAKPEKHSVLTKKEKIVIAVVVSVFVALFALIIINSAIISNISNEINSLESSLAVAKQEFAEVDGRYSSFIENIAKTVEEFAKANGMITCEELHP